MSTFLLIRHGHCNHIGNYIAGRSGGLHLSDKGKEQVETLALKLSNITIDAIFSSPLERATQTAGIIAKRKNIDFAVRHELNEIDYGLWTGKSFSELSQDPRWRLFNGDKGKVRIPGGEMMLEVALRMATLIESLRKKTNGSIILVSHGDPIKSAIAHYAGIPLDFQTRFDVQPASISAVTIEDYGATINYVNNVVYQD